MKPENIPIPQWSTVDALAWLKRQHVDLYRKYSDHFLTHNINGRIILLMNENDVRNVGVRDGDDRKMLMSLFALLKLRHTKEELDENASSSTKKSRFSRFVNV